jgi:hypothetical protein
MLPTQEPFRTMWEVDRVWLPDLRRRCDEAAMEGKAVTRLNSLDEVDAFDRTPSPGG